MAILNIDNDYSIMITHKCNWNCPYCAVNNSFDKCVNVEHEHIIKLLNGVPNNVNVTLFGGEPGLLPYEKLKEYFDILENKNCNIYVETNGKFFQYDVLCKRAYEIIFHCSENLDEEIIKKLPYQNVKYLIVVSDENLYKLEKFITKNNNIIFDIVPASYSHEQFGAVLSKTNKYFVIKKFYRNMTKDSIKRMLKDKDFDKVVFLKN